MKKLRKIPIKYPTYMSINCPADHSKSGLSSHIGDHSKCNVKPFFQKMRRDYRNSIEYKQIEVLNELIDRLNKGV